MVHNRYAERLDDKGKDFLLRVVRGAQRLDRLSARSGTAKKPWSACGEKGDSRTGTSRLLSLAAQHPFFAKVLARGKKIRYCTA